MNVINNCIECGNKLEYNIYCYNCKCNYFNYKDYYEIIFHLKQDVVAVFNSINKKTIIYQDDGCYHNELYIFNEYVPINKLQNKLSILMVFK